MKLSAVSRSAANCRMTIVRTFFVLSAFVAFLSQQAVAQTQTQTFSNPANNGLSANTFTVLPGMTDITIEVWGGGGRGGSRSTSGGGGGGGGGAYSRTFYSSLTSGVYNIHVGAGSTSNSSPGDDSWFWNATTVMAKGGNSAGLNLTAGATGGAAASGFGTTKYSGGNGANAPGGTNGGGGGSSAGTGNDGVNATTSTGATAPAGGGNGGNGRGTGNGAGSPGFPPGGGGGGARLNSGPSQNGGAGANGQVLITYTYCPTITASISGSTVLCQGSVADPGVPITFSATGSTAPYTFTYNINGGGNLTTAPGNPVVIYQSTGTPGTYTYNLLSVQDANGCVQNVSGSATVVVSSQTPTLTLTPFTNVSSPTCGDIITARLEVSDDFDYLLSLQYSVNWDFTKLQYISHTLVPIGGPSPAYDPFIGTVLVSAGKLTYSWSSPDFVAQSLGDGTTILTISFKVLSTGSSSISVSGDPAALEFSNSCLVAVPATAGAPASLDLQPIPCEDIAGEDEVCPNTTGISYSYPGAGTYSWTISDDGSINGSSTSQTVSVDAHNVCNGSFTLTVVYTDANGCVATCTKTVLVRDIVMPIISCPANTTVNCEDDNSSASTGVATATDNCDLTPAIGESQTSTQGSDPEECDYYNYVITRTWTATDACGNNTSCVQTITVQDVTKPGISCPANTTVNCEDDNSSASTGVATATDNCDLTPAIGESDLSTQDADVESCNHYNYSIIRTWTATDDCDNVSTCTQTVTVVDTTPPVVTCPPDVTIECDESTDPAHTGTAGSTDNCDPDPIETEIVSMDLSGCGNYTGTITRTWTATDACSNAASCDQLITVEDNTPPTMICPPDVTIECDESTLWTNTGMGVVSDNCTPTGLIARFPTDLNTQGGDPNECNYYSYTITRTWKSLDQCNNYSDPCDQIITVQDSKAPTIACPADVTIECDVSTDPAVNGDLGEATATDNCDLDLTGQIGYSDATDLSGCGGYTGTITRTWTAADECNNAASCDQIITIVDTSPPEITCPPDVTVECDESTDPAHTGIAGSTDNCDPDPIETEIVSMNLSGCGGYTGTITRTWTAKDKCQNESNCDQTITVVDTQIPVITLTGPPVMYICYNTAYVDPGATASDICEGDITANITKGIPAGLSAGTPGTYTVTYDVSDACSNPAIQVTRTVTVEPEPVATATPQQAVICSGNNAVIDVTTTVLGTPTKFKWSATYGDVTGGTSNPENGSVSFGPGAIDDGPLPLSNTTGVELIVAYTITPYTYGPNQNDDGGTGDDCLGSPVQTGVLVKPEPVGEDQNYSVCSGTVLSIDLQGIVDTNNGLPSSFSWYADNNPYVNGENSIPQSGSVINSTLTLVDPDAGPQEVYYHVSPTGLNGCPGEDFTITVNVESCTIDIDDPCTCLDNATMLTNGQFSESIVVTAPTGQTWTVVSAPGLYLTTSPAPPAAPWPIPSGEPLVEGPAGVYTLPGKHVDALGYSIIVTNGAVTRSASNTCYYPNPSLSGLVDVYCSQDGPQEVMVTAQLGDGSGPAPVENILFELIRQSDNTVVAPSPQSGTGNTFTFDPAALAQGFYTLRVTFDAAGTPGCVQPIEEEFEVRKVGCGNFPWDGN